MVKFLSTKLLIYSGVSAPAPPPGVERSEPFTDVAVLLKTTLSTVTGAPGNCQFKLSDQLVFTLFRASTPLQVTEGRVLVGPLVSVSRTAVLSPLSATLPAKAGLAEGSAPAVM